MFSYLDNKSPLDFPLLPKCKCKGTGKPNKCLFLSQRNSNLSWNRQVCWPVLMPQKHPWGKGMFVPLGQGKHQPPLWGCLDLRPLFTQIGAEQPRDKFFDPACWIWAPPLSLGWPVCGNTLHPSQALFCQPSLPPSPHPEKPLG